MVKASGARFEPLRRRPMRTLPVPDMLSVMLLQAMMGAVYGVFRGRDGQRGENGWGLAMKDTA